MAHIVDHHNHGPLLGPHSNIDPNVWGTPRRAHDFDNLHHWIFRNLGLKGFKTVGFTCASQS